MAHIKDLKVMNHQARAGSGFSVTETLETQRLPALVLHDPGPVWKKQVETAHFCLSDLYSGFSGASKKDQPSFTLRQVSYLCERLLKDHEEKIREEYEQILNTKLAGKNLNQLQNHMYIFSIFNLH